MSSKQITERNRLELLQTEYRRAWQRFTFAVERLRSITIDASTDNEPMKMARASVEDAAEQYRNARNALADWLLQEDMDRDEQIQASRSDRAIARCQAA